MLCLCDYILNILYSILELQTKLSEHLKSEGVRKTYFCFQHHNPNANHSHYSLYHDGLIKSCFFRIRTTATRPPLDPGPLFISNLVRFFSRPVLNKTIGDIAYSGDSVYPHKRNYEWRNKIQLISGASVQGESGLLNVNNTRSNFIVHIERYIS